ncbi:hypothetical protein Tco_1271094, partial [Tanacetum coccineum]
MSTKEGKKESHVIELEMLKLEKMTQKGACSNRGNAQRAKLSKKNGFHLAFSSIFGEDVEYFTPRLFFNMDKLEKQLNVEEFNEEIALVVFKVLKNQLQQLITIQISMDSDDKMTNHFFTKYTLRNAQMFQNILFSLMDFIKKAIAKRGLYKKAHDNSVHERTMQTHKGMISKDTSEIDNNVARASHDKDNIIEVQSSKNKMFENVFAHDHDKAHDHKKTKTDPKTPKEENILLKKEIEAYKERVWDFNEKQYIKKLDQEKNELQDQILKIKNATDFVKKAFKQDEDKYENKWKMGLGYMDPCPLGQAITCHPKLYDAKVLGLHYVKPDVHDTEEILNDAEESQVKMKEKQFHLNYERNLYDTFVPQMELSPKQEYFPNALISSESESSKEMLDLPILNMPKESRLLQMFDKLGDALSGFYSKINKTLLKDAERRWL